MHRVHRPGDEEEGEILEAEGEEEEGAEALAEMQRFEAAMRAVLRGDVPDDDDDDDDDNEQQQQQQQQQQDDERDRQQGEEERAGDGDEEALSVDLQYSSDGFYEQRVPSWAVQIPAALAPVLAQVKNNQPIARERVRLV